jgi:quinol monooxygenase YgiN
MLILQVQIHVKPECVDAFRAATIDNARNSALEPGIARFDFVQHSDDPHRFSLWEVYRTQEAVEQHKQTAHYARWIETVTDMMAEPRTRAWYTSVFPGDEGW